MNYLIKSIKWTKNDEVETWWEPNNNGYTNFICNAGVYTDADKEEMKKDIGKSLAFIPLTQKLIEKGKEQVKEVIQEEKRGIKYYEKLIKMSKGMIEKHKEHFKELEEMERLIYKEDLK